MSNPQPSDNSSDERENEGGRSPVERLAEGYLQRLRDGEKPSVTEYAEAHPELAEEICEVFPTLAMLEQIAPRPEDGPPSEPSDFKGIPAQLGEYRLLREIGRGGMGIVYEAEHDTMRRRVALKLLPASIAAEGMNLQRFLREARVAGRLHHTNIVPVFEVGASTGIHYYAMQYIRGQNLDVVIEELKHLRNGAPPALAPSSGGVEASGSGSESLSRTIAQGLLTGATEHARFDGADVGMPPSDQEQFSLADAETVVPEQAASRWRESAGANPEADASGSPGRNSEAEACGSPGANPQENVCGPRAGPVDSSEFSSIGTGREGYFQRVARAGVQVADALAYAHGHGILHRDIKPSNLILDTEGTVWVTDFGLARNEDDRFTHTGDIVGTLRYMAPERFRGRADERSDLYSLGLTLYELCTLRHAFDGADRAQLIQQLTQAEPARPSTLNPAIPRDLETIILKAIAADAPRRYQSAGELAEDLRRFLSDRPVLARRTTWPERFWRWCRRNPVPAVLSGCVAVLLAVLVAGSLLFAWNERQQASLLAEENERALDAERDLRLANRLATRRLYESYVGRAQAGRWSRRPGQNVASLQALSRAAEILPQLNLDGSAETREKLQLRNETIAAMTLTDLREVRRWPVKSGSTTAVAFDDQYRRYAQSDEQGRILVRRVSDNALLAELPGFGARAWMLQFSPDGRFLASKRHHGPPQPSPPVVQISDLSSGEAVVELGENLGLAPVAFSRDGRRAAIGLGSGQVNLYALPEGRLLRTLSLDGTPVGLAFGPNGRQLACAAERRMWFEIVDWESESRRRVEVPAAVTTIAWNRAGRLLACGTAGGPLFLYNGLEWDGDPVRLDGHTARVTRLFFGHREGLLASQAWDGSLRLWDTTTRQQLLRVEGTGLATFTGFRHDDRQLAFARRDDSFGLWEVVRSKTLKHFGSPDPPAARWMVKFHPTEPRLLASATSSGVELWDARRGELLKTLHGPESYSVLFTADGRSLLMGGRYGVKRWALEREPSNAASALSVRLEGPETIVRRAIKRIDLDSRGQRLIVQTDFDTATIYDLAGENEPVHLNNHRQLDRVLLSPDGRRAVTATWQGSGIRVWDAETGKLLRDLAPEQSSAAAAFSPDGRWLAASTGRHRFLWDARSWKPVYTAQREQPDGWPGAVAFSPDGRLLAMPMTRFVPQLLDPRSRQTLAVLEPPHPVSLSSMDFSPDGRWLATAEDVNMQLWDLKEMRSRLVAMGLSWETLATTAGK